MKIFIYRHLLNVELLSFYDLHVKRNSFVPHFEWFTDILRLLALAETDDPEIADYFFIPLFLIPFQFYNREVASLFNSCQYLHRGRHLLFASGDYGQRKKSLYEGHHPGRAYAEIYEWLDERFALVALESTADLRPSDIAIFPYQYQDIPVPTDTPSPSRIGTQDFLYSFRGVLSYPQLHSKHIRGGVLRSFAGRGRDWFIGTPQDAFDAYGDQLGASSAFFARSVFTLCPAGFGRWTFRWIEALLHGSIPVIISDGYLLPFRQQINWDRYVVHVPESLIGSLDDLLRSFDIETIARIQSNIIQDRHLFTRTSCLNLLLINLQDQCRRRREIIDSRA